MLIRIAAIVVVSVFAMLHLVDTLLPVVVR